MPKQTSQPYTRYRPNTKDTVCVFNVQLAAALWPKIQRKATSAGMRPIPWVTTVLQQALIRRGIK